MPSKEVRKVGAYAKLVANYAADDAIMEAGEAAELLFVRALAFCSTSDSDGFISEQQIIRYVGAGMRDAKKRANRLVAVGIWEARDGGYYVRSWTKYHDTAEEKGRALRADAERKRRERGQLAAVPPESERSPDGQVPDRVPESLSLIQDRTEEEQDRDTDAPTSGQPTARQISTAFEEFWKAYPRKEGKGNARRNYERAVKRGVPPSEILTAATAYATAKRGVEAKFVKMPEGWLTAERWSDEAPMPVAAGERPWWERR